MFLSDRIEINVPLAEYYWLVVSGWLFNSIHFYFLTEYN